MSSTYLLLVDAGNSALKFQCHLIKSPRLPQSTNALQQTTDAVTTRIDNDAVTPEGLQMAWRQAALALGADLSKPLDWQLSWSGVGPRVVMDCVAAAFSDMTDKTTPLPHRSLAQLKLPMLSGAVMNRYARPEQLGTDRWISAIGAAASSMIAPGETHMLVSAGTATTIDLLRVADTEPARYEFLGGWIFPGVGLMNASLRQGTRDLQLSVDTPCVAAADIPNDTRVAIAQGIGLAQTAWLAPLVERFGVCRVWLHGGASGYWQEALRLVDRDDRLAGKIQVEPNLIFAGLMALARADAVPG